MTSIEWTHLPGCKGESWNPIRARNLTTGKVGWHCEHVNEACRHCYAEAMNRWRGTGLDYKPGNSERLHLFLDEKALLKPLRWKKPARHLRLLDDRSLCRFRPRRVA